MARRTTALFSLLLLLSLSSDHVLVSAQVGTVHSALFDFIRNMNKAPAPSQPTPTGQQQPSQPAAQKPQPAGGNSVSGNPAMFNMYSQMMGQPSQQSAARSAPPRPPTQPQPAPSASDPTKFYNQLMRVVQNNPPPPPQQQQPLPAPAPRSTTLRNQSPRPTPPFLDPFPATAAPPRHVKPPPKILPFVPPEWNLPPKGQRRQTSPWGKSNVQSVPSAWGHHAARPTSYRQGPTAWEQYPGHYSPHSYNPHRHNQLQHRRAHQPPHARRHPMSNMMMVPSFRDMVNKQATQFGDLAYYQQHGCVDPTPTRPGPGGIRPSQTLWYGCASPVSRMVCAKVGKTLTGKSNAMTTMMSMMNPSMTRMFEQCLTPKMVTQMMFSSMSGGGVGGMNPMMMMMMNGGGGGAAMMPMMMMMMNQQNQQAAMGGQPSTGLGGNPSPSVPPGTTFGSGPTISSSPSSSFPSSSPNKSVYKDPTGANTLISQAARIPVGAAQPAKKQPSANPVLNAFSSMFGGNSNSPGGATGAGPSSAAGGAGGPATLGSQCKSLMPMMMTKMMAGGEGLNSPEAMEALAEMRRQFLPYSCQELRIKYTGMPLRLCCPGRVDQPSIMDLFKAKNAGAA